MKDVPIVVLDRWQIKALVLNACAIGALAAGIGGAVGTYFAKKGEQCEAPAKPSQPVMTSIQNT